MDAMLNNPDQEIIEFLKRMHDIYVVQGNKLKPRLYRQAIGALRQAKSKVRTKS